MMSTGYVFFYHKKDALRPSAPTPEPPAPPRPAPRPLPPTPQQLQNFKEDLEALATRFTILSLAL